MRRRHIVSIALAVAATLAVVLPLVLVDGSAQAGPAVPQRLQGFTSQHERFALRLSADRRTIRRIDVAYRADCLDGGISMELADTLHTPVKVRPDGSFGVERLGARLSIHGRIGPRRSSGTLTIDMAYGGFMRCTTDKLTWSARPPAAQRG